MLEYCGVRGTVEIGLTWKSKTTGIQGMKLIGWIWMTGRKVCGNWKLSGAKGLIGKI